MKRIGSWEMARLWINLTLGCAMSACALASPPLLDAPWRAFDVADFPQCAPIDAEYGDLDGDGDLDAAVARGYYYAPGLCVLLNNGDGTFAQEVLYDLPTQMILGGIALADIDKDGDLDAVATVAGNSGLDNRIVVWRNNGNGVFGTATTFASGPGPLGLVIADFTGDGFPDVVTADNGYVAGNNATISLLRHNGQSGPAAGFLPPVATTVGDNCTKLSAADIDGDGDIDLCVGRVSATNDPNNVSILRNNGTGSFSISQSFPGAPSANSSSPAVQFADMNRDGRPDLLSCGAMNGGQVFGIVVLRLNNGNGTYGAAQEMPLAPFSFTPYDVSAGDVNRDGWNDILVVTPSGRAMETWHLIRSNGLGGFQSPIFFHAAKWTYTIDAIDVDRDGDLDVATLANDSSVVTVHRNLGVGSFLVPTSYAFGSSTSDLVSGDVDNDGDVDLVGAGGNTGRILRNQGNGTFVTSTFTLPFTSYDLVLSDMNGDGWLDLVVSSGAPPYNFAVLLNDKTGFFLPGVVTFVNGSDKGELGAFDLDKDGDRDVVMTDHGPLSRVYIYSNVGDGITFAFARILGDFDGLPFGVQGGDINRDGTIDLVFDNAFGITVYPNLGNFVFGEPLPTGQNGYPFVLGDANNDSLYDVFFQFPQPSFGTVEVGVMLGYGDGVFDGPSRTPGPNGLESSYRISMDLDVVDINRDGKQDIVLTNDAPNDLSIFLGRGDGTFRPQDRYGVGYLPRATEVADFDRDGVPDSATVISLPPSGLQDVVVVLKGTRKNPRIQDQSHRIF